MGKVMVTGLWAMSEDMLHTTEPYGRAGRMRGYFGRKLQEKYSDKAESVRFDFTDKATFETA
jgi:hypothetical protein